MNNYIIKTFYWTLFVCLLTACRPSDPCGGLCPEGTYCDNGNCFNLCRTTTCGVNETCVDGDCICKGDHIRDANGNCVHRDPCHQVSCGIHGHCDGGTCICDDGYVQDSLGYCTIEESAQFVSSYQVVQTCQRFLSSTYNCAIYRNSATQVSIVGLEYNWSDCIAIVDGDDLVIISTGPSSFPSNHVEGGRGTINGNQLEIELYIDVNGSRDTCVAVMTKS